jgi:serine/threonine protein kinase/tetratricopeptide (TPR) repeat protein
VIDDEARSRIAGRIEKLIGSHDRRPTVAEHRPSPDAPETDRCQGGPTTEADTIPADVTTIDAILIPMPADRARLENGDRRPAANGNGNGNRAGKVGRKGSGAGRFTVLKPYKSGGLGLVSIARDEDLHREVAYKEIREAFAQHPDKRARFVSEAEITGGLEHPGIVPVYALGRDAEGRPFYAMKFIRGKTLREAVVEFRAMNGPASSKREGLRDLIGRMIAVCDAMQYAHSRGVIHRDIKPTNIMIGKYGETLVVAWGLAKVFGRRRKARPTAGPSTVSTTDDVPPSDEPRFELHSETAEGETPPGNGVGTPGYMSPEQAKGADLDTGEDEVGPRTDIYSLGATLYYVLSGKTSIEDRGRIDYLRKLNAGEFVSPRSVDPTVPRALDAICMKAMALAPADRYGTPHALSSDLKHWLADEPVLACRDPLQARVYRWVRRHKPIVAGGLMFLVATIGVLAVTLGTILREKHRADASLDRLVNAAWESIYGRMNRGPVRVGKYDISRSLLDDQADALFDLYLVERPNDLLALERAAIVANDAASLHLVFGEQFPKARAQFDKAIRYFVRLGVEVPEDLRFQQYLITAYLKRGELSLAEERWDDVETDQQRVLRLTEDWPHWTVLRAWALQLRAKFLSLRGKRDEAASAIGEAIRLLRPIVENPVMVPPDSQGRPLMIVPDSQEWHLMVLSQRIRAVIALDRKRPEEARDAIDEGLRLVDKMSPHLADDPNLAHHRACLLTLRASIDAGTPGGFLEAEVGFRKAVGICRDLTREYPEMHSYALTEARALMGLSGLLLASNGGNPDAIAADLARAGTILDATMVSPNAMVELDTEKGRLLILLGKLDARRGNLDEARKKITRAEAAIADLSRRNPLSSLVREYYRYAREALDDVKAASSRR